MPWFKVDDGFHSHPKVVELDLATIGLWTVAGTWCTSYLTDGAITERQAVRLGGDSAQCAALVDSGLWSRTGDGYQFKDWADYQPLKETVEAERRAAQDRMRSVRAKKKGVRANDADGSGEQDANVQPNRDRSSDEVRVTPSQPIPVPIPAHPSSKDEKEPAPMRGTRVPSDFVITDDMRSWAATEVPNVDVDKKLAEWIDFWKGVPGRGGVKIDWLATWKNGMRKQQEFALRDLARNPQSAPLKRRQFKAGDE